MARLDFWFSVGSTYSYLSVMRIGELATREGLEIAWRPFDVRAIMMEIGNSPFIGKPDKAAHMWRDIERRAPRHGLAPRLPAPYPLADLALPNAVALLGMEQGWGVDFVRALYRRWFEEGLLPDEEPALGDSLREVGQAPETVIAAAKRDETARKLADETQAARAKGVFGSPSFIVGEELFWGDDRLEDAVQWAREGRLAPA